MSIFLLLNIDTFSWITFKQIWLHYIDDWFVISWLKSNRSTVKSRWGLTFPFGSRLLLTGPLSHYFYQLMEVWMPTTDPYCIVKRLLLDRLVFAPGFLFIFYLVMNILEVGVGLHVSDPGWRQLVGGSFSPNDKLLTYRSSFRETCFRGRAFFWNA